MLLEHSGLALALFFLLVTYLISAYEKIFDWEKTSTEFGEMYKNVFNVTLVKISVLIILALEIVSSSIIGIALFDIIVLGSIEFSQYAFILSGLLLVILLVGLRIIKDYPGASRLGIYFMISMFGLFWSQYL